MRRLLFSLSVILCASAAHADVLRICTLGDLQNVTDCVNETSAWDHGEAAVQWIVDNPDMCDVVLFPGDVTLFVPATDCWCATQDPPVCEDLVNPDFGTPCESYMCNDPEATACDGGVPGSYCEWERVKTLVDMVHDAGIPYIVTAGNHDADIKDYDRTCEREFTIYNSYFGAGHLSPDFKQSSVFHHEMPCDLLEDGSSEIADSSWHIINAAGVDWLLINISWTSIGIEENGRMGMTDPTLEWIRETIDSHLHMPTILITHCGVGEYCYGTGWPTEWTDFYENAWCGARIRSWKHCTASEIYKELLFDPIRSGQILGMIGGHIRYNAISVTQNTLFRTFGVTFDYTNSIDGFPAWQTEVNGGGGIVQIIKIDPAKGAVTTKGYSPYEGEWANVFGDEPSSHYELDIPMCSARRRGIEWTAEACPRRERSPECCVH